jgi:hypothetical protein
MPTYVEVHGRDESIGAHVKGRRRERRGETKNQGEGKGDKDNKGKQGEARGSKEDKGLPGEK